MINIEATINAEDAYMLTADGHAGADRNEQDHDLLCAAVSAIVQTLAFSCAQIEEVSTVYHTSSGHATLVVTNYGELEGEITPRFRMALDGLEGLAQQYPGHIRVKINGAGGD